MFPRFAVLNGRSTDRIMSSGPQQHCREEKSTVMKSSSLRTLKGTMGKFQNRAIVTTDTIHNPDLSVFFLYVFVLQHHSWNMQILAHTLKHASRFKNTPRVVRPVFLLTRLCYSGCLLISQNSVTRSCWWLGGPARVATQKVRLFHTYRSRKASPAVLLHRVLWQRIVIRPAGP